MKNKRYLLILTVLILFPLTLSAIENDNIPSRNEAEKTSNSGIITENFDRESKAILASTNRNYPVTPGDVYAVSYIQAGTLININCIVNSDYGLNLGVIGEIDGSGKSFAELKRDIKKKVDWAFPDSYSDVNIISTGFFEVYLTGEVKISKLITAWGLSRLSDITDSNKTAYTSLRNIAVTDSEGKTEYYDLYKALYEGDLTQNPTIKPGSVISFSQYERQVSIAGEVKRAGTYQLLATDNLEDLIRYAMDFTDEAYTENLIIESSTYSGNTSGGDIHYINFNENKNVSLLNLDRVTVRSKKILLPVCFFEGAVGLNDSSILEAANTVSINFSPGTKLSTILISKKDLFSDRSDLENSYYYRAETNTTSLINISKILFEYNLDADTTVYSNDRLIVPFRQLFVTVNGAVTAPGRYPYVPGKEFNYYINLAGGFDTFKNDADLVSIYNVNHEKQDINRIIEKEDLILAESNSFAYGLKEYGPLITAAASIAGVVISVISLMQ